MTKTLRYQVHVSGQLPQSGRGPLPDGSTRTWSPISSTLIVGDRGAVLVDPPMTLGQADEVGEWIAATGRRLDAIYITHGHGDHWFGATPILKRFPGAVVYATAGTQRVMSAHGEPGFRAGFWDKIFPGQIPSGRFEVETVGPDGFEFEGTRLQAVEAGHTDTDETTMLHVPEIGLLVAGDAVYNGVHPYLTESGGVGGIDQWLAALDVAERLNPVTVVAGHKDPRAADSPEDIDATRRYLTDARRLLDEVSDADGFYQAMLGLHPDRINPGALWGGASALFPPSPA